MIELLFRLRNAISPVTALIIPGYVQLRSMSAHFARPKDKHDGIHEAVLRVLERERQGPDDFKGQGLPKAYCAAVGAHDEVELRCSCSWSNNLLAAQCMIFLQLYSFL